MALMMGIEPMRSLLPSAIPARLFTSCVHQHFLFFLFFYIISASLRSEITVLQSECMALQMVEPVGIEPTTFRMRRGRSPI